MGEHNGHVQHKNVIRPEGYGVELNEPDIHLMAHAFINLYVKTAGRQMVKADHRQHEQEPPCQAGNIPSSRA
ncbi:hypothetical protein ACE3NQ_29065 [Paenibacillus terreus]|uniref:Uncharacterized protein n=1 Tax=Paenibacillus terreus TaxID=1387834 RepID=A0ABV5BGY5_9BACL